MLWRGKVVLLWVVVYNHLKLQKICALVSMILDGTRIVAKHLNSPLQLPDYVYWTKKIFLPGNHKKK